MPVLPIVFSSFSVLLAGLTLALGISVALTNHKKRSHRLFVWLCALLFAWHLCSAVRSVVLFRYLEVCLLLPLPWVLSRFFQAWLPAQNQLSTKILQPSSVIANASLFLLVGCEALLLYAGIRHSITPMIRWPETIYRTIYLFSWIAILFNFYPVLWAYRLSPFQAEKKRLLAVLFLGLLSSFIAAIDYLPTPVSGNGPFLGAFLSVIYLYFLQQSLFLERVLDSVEFFGRILVVCIFVALLSALYSLLLILKLPPNQTLPWLVAFTLILYKPLHSLIERILEKFWSQDKEPLDQALVAIRHVLASTLSLEEGIARTVQILQRSWHPTRLAIYLLDKEGSGYEMIGSYGEHFAHGFDAITRRPLLDFLREHRWTHIERLYRDSTVNTPPATTDRTVEKKEAKGFLEELNVQWAFGIFSAGKEPSLSPSIGQKTEQTLLGVLFVQAQSKEFSRLNEEMFGLEVAALLGVLLQNTKLYDRMKEKDRMAALGEMSAGLAHEIRNPLGAIKGAAELLQEQQKNEMEDSKELIDILVEETHRLNEVVSLFLDYARPHKISLQPVQLNELIKKTIPLALASWQKKDKDQPKPFVDVSLELAPFLPNLYGDIEQLRRVLLNLTLNALEAIEEQTKTGHLRLQTAFIDDSSKLVEIRITDNGPGIPTDQMKHLFVPFYTTKNKGTGLGLPICQRIIENHHGTISVKSRPGEETTFTIRLPLSTNLS